MGAGLRTFRVRVRDVVGNERYTEDRTMWFSPDGNGPPQDEAPPTIVVGHPLQDAFLPTEGELRVIGTMFDDVGLARVELEWHSRFGVRNIGCPFESERYSCAVDGDTYTWVFRPREGQRTFRMRAIDLVGNVTETPQIAFTVDPTAPPAVEDGNDAIESAVRLGCDETVSRDGNDSDWFLLVAEPGTTVSLRSDDPKLQLLVTDGAQRLAQGEAATQLVVGEAPLWLAATPTSAVDGGFTLSMACEAPAAPKAADEAPEAQGCTTAGAAGAPGALAALLALRRRRRR